MFIQAIKAELLLIIIIPALPVLVVCCSRNKIEINAEQRGEVIISTLDLGPPSSHS